MGLNVHLWTPQEQMHIDAARERIASGKNTQKFAIDHLKMWALRHRTREAIRARLRSVRCS